jgi:BON domain-containing protein
VEDSKITTQVKSKIASDVRFSSLTNVSVNTTNGVVTLAGEVESEKVRQTAEAVAHEVPGVVRVNNELQTQFHPVGERSEIGGTNPEDKGMAAAGTKSSSSASSQDR